MSCDRCDIRVTQQHIHRYRTDAAACGDPGGEARREEVVEPEGGGGKVALVAFGPEADPRGEIPADYIGMLCAFDAANGRILWHTRIGNLSNAPQTFLVDGKQHVLVAVNDTVFAFRMY